MAGSEAGHGEDIENYLALTLILLFPAVAACHLRNNQLIPFVPSVTPLFTNCGVRGVSLPCPSRFIAAPVADRDPNTISSTNAKDTAVSGETLCRLSHFLRGFCIAPRIYGIAL